MFNFKGLISKYHKGFIVAIIEKEGYYDPNQGGKYIEGEKKAKLLKPSAIVPLSQDDLKMTEGGFYSSDNRKLYTYTKLKKGTNVYNRMLDGSQRIYRILAEKDYSDYDKGLHIYILERADNED